MLLCRNHSILYGAPFESHHISFTVSESNVVYALEVKCSNKCLHCCICMTLLTHSICFFEAFPGAHKLSWHLLRASIAPPPAVPHPPSRNEDSSTKNFFFKISFCLISRTGLSIASSVTSKLGPLGTGGGRGASQGPRQIHGSCQLVVTNRWRAGSITQLIEMKNFHQYIETN